jgi:hypothetical protein
MDQRSPETLRSYLCKLRKAREVTGARDTRTMLAAPARSLAALRAHYTTPATLKQTLTVVLAVLAHNSTWADAHPKAAAQWKEAHTQAARTAALDGKVTRFEAVAHKFVCMSDVVAARRRLRAAANSGTLAHTLTHLMLVFFSQVPPKRADYNELSVVPAGGAEPRGGNYVLLSSSRAAELVMHDYKTAKRGGQAFRERLSRPAAAALRESLLAFPRKYVFPGRDGGPMTAAAFSQFVIRQCRALFGKPVGVSQLRHAYVTDLFERGATAAEKRAAAVSMQHSSATQKTYVVRREDGAPVCRRPRTVKKAPQVHTA